MQIDEATNEKAFRIIEKMIFGDTQTPAEYACSRSWPVSQIPTMVYMLVHNKWPKGFMEGIMKARELFKDKTDGK